MTPLTIVVGAAMLLFGRRLFWVFVAGTGFVVGALLAAQFLASSEAWVLLGAAVLCGVLGAVIALFAQKLAIGIAGFLGGGYLAHAIAVQFGMQETAWIAFLVAGVIGAILLMILFNWALVALSSLVGAAVITQELTLTEPWPVVVFLLLLIFGLAVQSRQLRRPEKASPPARD